MKRTIRTAVVALILAAGMTGSAAAEPFEDGSAAFERGDYATATWLWRPFAEQGDADAQYRLGGMYAEGQGVPQNFVTAHMWLKLGGPAGNKEAVELLDDVAAKMTVAQIAEERLAREWKPRQK
jgi:TPR repeat protein